MKYHEVLARAVEERGIPVAELARRCGLDRELTRRTLLGTRRTPADEFIALCAFLDLSLDEFRGCDLDGSGK